MAFNFILNLVIFVSLAVIVLLLSRGVERIQPIAGEKTGADTFEKVFSRLRLKEFDEFLNKLLERFLRVIRIIVLKIDNMTHISLNKLIAKKRENLPVKTEAAKTDAEPKL